MPEWDIGAKLTKGRLSYFSVQTKNTAENPRLVSWISHEQDGDFRFQISSSF